MISPSTPVRPSHHPHHQQQHSPSSVKAFVDMQSRKGRTPGSTSAKVAANVAEPSKSKGARAQATPRTDTMQDRMKRIMDDPAEWAKFRAEMAAGGHVTNGATAMELAKRAARAQEESEDAEALKKRTSGLGDDQDVLEAGAALGDQEEEECSHQQKNIVNKGLQWINQTLAASTTSMMHEASASQLHASKMKPRPRRRSVAPRFSLDHGVTRDGSSTSLIGTLAEELDHIDISAVDRSVGGNSNRGVSRSNSLDTESQRRASMNLHTKYSSDMTTDNKNRDDEDEHMVVGQSSSHRDLRRGLEQTRRGSVLGDAAKAVRRGSLVEYLSGMTGDDGIDDMGGAALPPSSLAGRQRRERRHSATTTRPARRRNSFIMTAVRGLAHEIDAADYLEGGGS